MAENKGDVVKGTLNQRLDKDAKDLERESRHQPEGAERRDVADQDVGEDRIKEKGLRGDRSDESSGSERRDAPSGRDNG